MSIELNTIQKCKVTGISKFGAFVELEDKSIGMIHISEVSKDYLDDINKALKIGDTINAKVVSISDDGKVSLSIRQLEPDEKRPEIKEAKIEQKTVSSPGSFIWEEEKPLDDDFEQMMKKFKRTSEEKMSELKRGESRGYSRKRGK